MDPRTYAKAIIGAAIAGLGAVAAAWSGDHTIDVGEWLTAAVATLSSFGGVYAIENKSTSASKS